MFDVGGITTGNTGSNDASLSSAISGGLDGDALLMLLVAELQYQDPLNPVSNQEYITQLTQLTSVDELQSIRELLEDQVAKEVSDYNAQLLSMIGQEVTVLDNEIELQSGKDVELRFQAPSGVEVEVTLYDANGNVVRRETVSGSSSTWTSYTFDGRNDSGVTLPDGQYYARVSTLPDESGNVIDYSVFQIGRVVGVDYTGSMPILELENGQMVSVANIAAVHEAG